MSAFAKPKAVVWDMDGTLIDQTQPIIRCYAEVIEGLGYAKPEPEKIHRSMGGPMVSTMALFVKPEEIKEADVQFRKRFPEIMYDGLIVLAGANESITWFASNNIPQVILTNKHGETARAVSQHCGFSRSISSCIGNTDTEWHKPQSELTKHALSTIGAPSDGGVLIGDSPTDVATAMNAGLDCIGIATGAHSQSELIAAGAKHTFASLTEMLKALA